MNAYEFLKIDKLLDSMRNSPMVFDARIKVDTKRKLDEGIYQINKILTSRELNMESKIHQIDDILKELRKIAVAYDHIATQRERTEYDSNGRLDIDGIFAQMDSILKNATTLTSNGRTENAFQILNVSSNDDGRKGPYEQDMNIRTKTYQAINFALANLKLADIRTVENLLTDLTRYMWAYSNIGDSQQRQNYRYKIIARSGDEAAKRIGKPNLRALKNQQEYVIEMPKDERYDTVTISKAGVVLSEDFMLSEPKGYMYVVSRVREKSDDENTDQNTNSRNMARDVIAIVSNIDMGRMNNDAIYRAHVEEELLSDESIKLGQKYLGGYVGELDENGNKIFNSECVGMCRAWKRSRNLKRTKGCTNDQSNRSEPTNPNTDDGQINNTKLTKPTNPTNPDPNR